MTKQKIFFLLITICFASGTNLKAQAFKHKMYDPSYNYNEVVREGDAYFASLPKEEKHGYMSYQRWKYSNSFKWGADGLRDIDKSRKFMALSTLERNASRHGDLTHIWRESGPLKSHQPNGVFGADGMGRVDFYYVEPLEEQLIYLAVRGGSFWRSEDGGQNWEGSTTDSLFTGLIKGMSVAPSNNNRIYLKVQNSYSEGIYSEQGIYASDDGGRTWAAKPMSNFYNQYSSYHFLSIDPSDEDVVYFNNGQDLYKTMDGFETFSLVEQFENEQVYDVKFHPNNPNQIFLSTTSELFRSDNNGMSFSYVSSYTSAFLGGVRRIYIPKNWDTHLYLVTIDEIFRSYNLGVDLNPVYTTGNGAIWSFSPSEIDSTRLLYGAVFLHMSNDGGNTFQWIQETDVIHVDVRNIQNINENFYVGTDGFLSKSEDGGETWEVLNLDMNIRENVAVNISHSHVNTYISGAQDNGTELQWGEELYKIGGGDGMTGVIHPMNRNIIVTASQNGTRSLTIDAGRTRHGLNNLEQSGVWDAPIISNYLDFSQVYSFLGGQIFKGELMGLEETLIFDSDLRIFAADIAYNNSNIFAFTGKPLTFGLDSNFVFVSIDGGQSFQKRDQGLPIGNLASNLAFSPIDDNTFIVTYGTENSDQTIFITHNLGQTWANITFELANIPIEAIAIDHLESPNIYVGTTLGVFTKKIGEQEWHLYSNHLPKVVVNDLHIHFGSNQLFATTYGRGTWITHLIGKRESPRIEEVELSIPPDLFGPNPGDDMFVEAKIVYHPEVIDAYILYSVNNLSLDNRINLINSNDDTWVSTTSFPDGEIGDKIYFKLIAEGQDGDVSESFRYMYGLKKKDYCHQFMRNFVVSDNIYLKEFTLGDLNLVKSTGLGFYNLDEEYDLSLNQGESYTIDAITHSIFSNTNVELLVAFDWNNDFVFDIDSETYYLGTNPPFVTQPTSNSPLTFEVPSDLVSDSVRMRIHLVNSEFASYESLTNNLCNPGVYTEVLDLNVAISNFTSTSHFFADGRQISIHPNPTKGILFIDGIEGFENNSIELLNAFGQKIAFKKTRINDQFLLDISHLPSGVYHIVGNKEGEQFSASFVKVD